MNIKFLKNTLAGSLLLAMISIVLSTTSIPQAVASYTKTSTITPQQVNALGVPAAWNAATNTPTITSNVAYAPTNSLTVTTGGTINLNVNNCACSTVFAVGDMAYFDGTYWQQISSAGGGSGVPSVNGITTALNIVAGTNVTVTTAGSSVSIASTGGGSVSGNISVSAVSATSEVIAAGSVSGVASAGVLQVSKTDTSTSGTNYFLNLTPTYNQVSSVSANTDIYMNRTTTSAGSGAQLLMWIGNNGIAEFTVDIYGNATATSALKSGGIGAPNNGPLSIQAYVTNLAGGTFNGLNILPGGGDSSSSGTYRGLFINPTYTETGTASATDLLIQRTQTSVGSGAQYLIEAGTAAIPLLHAVTNTGQTLSVSYGAIASGRAYNTGTASDTIAAGISTTFESANTGSGAFTATFAAPTGDGERRRVCFKNTTGTITWSVTAPATATNGLPTTITAGNCIEVVYNSAAGTPANSPATTWVLY
jgi:hypothetical protein